MSPAIGVLLGTAALIGYFGTVVASCWFWYDVVGRRYPKLIDNLGAAALSFVTAIAVTGFMIAAAVAIWQ